MNITPVITENNMSFIWNVEDIKKQLAEQLEKYNGLVVTAENYEEMGKAKREIVKFRTAIKAFGDEQKRVLKGPYDKFVSELKDVLLEVERVEKPLVEQLTYFDEQEQREKQTKIEAIITEKIELYGLRQEYQHLIDRDPRWWRNKTSKLNDVVAIVDEQISKLAQRQQADDDMAKIQAEKRGMLEFAFDMMADQYDLTTPLEFEGLYQVIQNMPLDQAKEYLKAQFESRLKIEQAVKIEPTPVVISAIKANEQTDLSKNDNKFYTVVIREVSGTELGKLEGYLMLNNLEYEVQ